ncbi:MAG: Vault protein inter-alpha-trypsin [Chthonomonadales bacterium]|nr:Vault protein inter-alpha-trypsin [Chthonomonadales bacterium]
MFDPKGFENSRPDGFSVLEVVSGLPEEDGPRRFVPLKHTHLTGEIAGPLADLRLTQSFGYTAKECDKVLEAVYRFPLPGDAAVTGVTVRFGDVVLQAELKERAHAEAEYEAAKQEGRQATLATRESPDVFTLQVAGLKPDQEVVVETAYVQLARYEGADWTLRIPLTTSPRYVREDEGASRHAQGQPLLLLRDPIHRFSLDLKLQNADSIKSPTYPLEVSATEEGQKVRLRDGEVVPDRDCVLTWRAQQADQHPAMHLLLHDDVATRQVYFLALLAPPKTPRTESLVPREAILLVDHSGSMEGPKWEAADWTVTRFLQGLTPQDTFALGLFHDTTKWFAPKPVPATSETVAAAVKYLLGNKDDGGTNLGVALEQALSLPRTVGSRARHTLLVTDAEVSDGGRVLRLASEEAQQALRRRISVICIDAAPNALLATELAERGGGVSRFLTSDPQQEDITTALDTVLEDWGAPVLTGVRLAINRPKAEAVEHAVTSDAEQGGSWIDIGDLPAGRAVWVAGRVPRGDSADLSFRLVAEGGVEVAACRRDLEAATIQRPALKALFGARRVLGLEFLTTAHYDKDELRGQLVRLGYDPDTALMDPNAKRKLYGENVQQDSNATLRSLLAREALDYGLASAETAFVAVRTKAGEKVEGTVAIPNALPHGWSDRFDSSMAPRGMGLRLGGGSAWLSRSSPAPAPPSVAASYSAPPSDRYDAFPAQAADVDYMEQAAEVDYDEADMTKTSSLAKPGFVQQAVDALGGFLGGGGKAKSASSNDPARKAQARKQESFVPGTVQEGMPEMELRTLQEAAPRTGQVYSGVPNFVNGEAVLFDSTNTPLPRATSGRLSRLEVTFSQGVPTSLDSDLALLLYIDDMASPWIRVRLADLIQQGGARPLNILRSSGQVIRLVLVDPSGAWANQSPGLVVTLT